MGLGLEELAGPLWAPAPGSAFLTSAPSLPAADPDGVWDCPISLARGSLPSCAVFSVPTTTVPTAVLLGTALKRGCLMKDLETMGLGDVRWGVMPRGDRD